MPKLTYAVHAYAWTTHWSNETLPILDRAGKLGFDVLEIPLMEDDITSDDPSVRAAGEAYLKRCVELTAAMGGRVLTGVLYSAIGGKLDGFPTDDHWRRSADALRTVARHAASLGVTLGLEPVNRYEPFLVNTAAQALRLRELIGEPNVGVHLATARRVERPAPLRRARLPARSGACDVRTADELIRRPRRR